MDVPTGRPEPLPRALVDQLLDGAGAKANRDILADIIRSAVGLAGDDADRLDLKITSAALSEMREAFATFAPYRDIPKVTVFGSARTKPHDPLYEQARRLAAELAARDFMVVTGAGPGIMAAAMEGAGRERSFGVTIRLPFEERPNQFIDGDDKLVAMKYFFTRKLMLIKESVAFCALPGGFGTQDETFELFTLQQTGKAEPAPVVLLDVPDGNYWADWRRFVIDELVERGLVSPDDLDLFLVTHDVDEACREIVGFHRNYHSIRWSGSTLIIRLKHPITDEQLDILNDTHGDVLLSGRIDRTDPINAERSSNDNLDLPRIALALNPYRQAGLRRLINDLNAFVASE